MAEAALVPVEHAGAMFEDDVVAEVLSRALGEALQHGAEAALRAVAHEQSAVGGVAKLEHRDRGAGIDLEDLGMDDAVDAEQERSRGGLCLEELRIAGEEERHRLLAEPAQNNWSSAGRERRRGDVIPCARLVAEDTKTLVVGSLGQLDVEEDRRYSKAARWEYEDDPLRL